MSEILEETENRETKSDYWWFRKHRGN